MIGVEQPVLHPELIAPGAARRGAFTLLLGDGREYRGQELAADRSRVDMLFFEHHRDADCLQLSDDFKAFFGVAREAGDGFGQHTVYLSAATVGKEPLEVLPLFGGGSGHARIGIYVDQLPVGLSGNQLHVVFHLRGERVHLIEGIGADTAVRSYADRNFFRSGGGLYGDNTVPVICQRCAAYDFSAVCHTDPSSLYQQERIPHSFPAIHQN